MLKSDASGTQEHLEHLAQVRALAQSVADSISAIEQNDLKRFEIHLATQERLCNRLTGSKWILPSTARDEAVDGPAPRTSMPEEIRSAYIALGRVDARRDSLSLHRARTAQSHLRGPVKACPQIRRNDHRSLSQPRRGLPSRAVRDATTPHLVVRGITAWEACHLRCG